MKNKIFYLLAICFLVFSCKREKEVINQNIRSNTVYGINNEVIYQSNVEKDKQKTNEQYISIVYSNLFATDISQDDLSALAEFRRANGDKQLVDELLLNGFVNTPGINVPSNAQMRQDIEKFIDETYLRFFLRLPTAYELYEMKREIEMDDGLTPELIFQGFALSTEYKFY